MEHDIKNSHEVITLCKNHDIAVEFYQALCNMRWRKIPSLPPDELVVEKLKGNEPDVWSCSWRFAGAIIADIRNSHHSTREDYMDFYCSGNEGTVTDTVRDCFKNLGWEPYPWEDEHH